MVVTLLSVLMPASRRSRALGKLSPGIVTLEAESLIRMFVGALAIRRVQLFENGAAAMLSKIETRVTRKYQKYIKPQTYAGRAISLVHIGLNLRFYKYLTRHHHVITEPR
jgi:hypothetical protein